MEKVNFTESFSAEFAIGKLFSHKNKNYKIDSILKMGKDKIVYELLELSTKNISYVLKVYRERNIEVWEHSRDIYNELKGRGISIIEGAEWILINGWPAIFEPHLNPPGSDVIVFSSNSILSDIPEKGNEIIALVDNANFNESLELCNSMLEKYPMHPWYLMMKVESHFCIIDILSPILHTHNQELVNNLKLVLEIDSDNKRAKKMWNIYKNLDDS